MKRFTAFFLSLVLLCSSFCSTAFATAEWPDNISISAEGGIVMDAGSGAVLYGKNIHTAYFPASITKILTALIVIENCDMDDIVTFSRNAVHNVEPGSTSAGMDVGDQLTVRDCLYALVLRSANEVANALAEHTAGSIEAFADMMNERAASLCCTDSHFCNPSGLNNPDHYTSAYDMALIAQAAFQNEAFVTIDSTLYYDLPPTKRNPDGFRIYPGHRMMKKNAPQYYPGIIGGKTGYTSLAGNTLVTCAEKNNTRLIAVVLNGHQTHYTDTKALLDFGFSSFQSLKAAEIDTAHSSVANDMTIAGLPTTDLSVLSIQKDCRISLPKLADPADITSSISYELPPAAPQDAVAQISYEYGGHAVGAAYLIRQEPDTAAREADIAMARAMTFDETAALSPTGEDNAPAALSGDLPVSSEEEESGSTEPSDTPAFQLYIPQGMKTGLILFVVLGIVGGGLLVLKFHIEKQEAVERAARYQRRQKRLEDIGMSTAEFDLLMEKKRTDSALKQSQPKKRPRNHPSFLDRKN